MLCRSVFEAIYFINTFTLTLPKVVVEPFVISNWFTGVIALTGFLGRTVTSNPPDVRMRLAPNVQNSQTITSRNRSTRA